MVITSSYKRICIFSRYLHFSRFICFISFRFYLIFREHFTIKFACPSVDLFSFNLHTYNAWLLEEMLMGFCLLCIYAEYMKIMLINHKMSIPSILFQDMSAHITPFFFRLSLMSIPLHVDLSSLATAIGFVPLLQLPVKLNPTFSRIKLSLTSPLKSSPRKVMWSH